MPRVAKSKVDADATKRLMERLRPRPTSKAETTAASTADVVVGRGRGGSAKAASSVYKHKGKGTTKKNNKKANESATVESSIIVLDSDAADEMMDCSVVPIVPSHTPASSVSPNISAMIQRGEGRGRKRERTDPFMSESVELTATPVAIAAAAATAITAVTTTPAIRSHPTTGPSVLSGFAKYADNNNNNNNNNTSVLPASHSPILDQMARYASTAATATAAAAAAAVAAVGGLDHRAPYEHNDANANNNTVQYVRAATPSAWSFVSNNSRRQPLQELHPLTLGNSSAESFALTGAGSGNEVGVWNGHHHFNIRNNYNINANTNNNNNNNNRGGVTDTGVATAVTAATGISIDMDSLTEQEVVRRTLAAIEVAAASAGIVSQQSVMLANSNNQMMNTAHITAAAAKNAADQAYRAATHSPERISLLSSSSSAAASAAAVGLGSSIDAGHGGGDGVKSERNGSVTRTRSARRTIRESATPYDRQQRKNRKGRNGRHGSDEPWPGAAERFAEVISLALEDRSTSQHWHSPQQSPLLSLSPSRSSSSQQGQYQHPYQHQRHHQRRHLSSDTNGSPAKDTTRTDPTQDPFANIKRASIPSKGNGYGTNVMVTYGTGNNIYTTIDNATNVVLTYGGSAPAPVMPKAPSASRQPHDGGRGGGGSDETAASGAHGGDSGNNGENNSRNSGGPSLDQDSGSLYSRGKGFNGATRIGVRSHSGDIHAARSFPIAVATPSAAIATSPTFVDNRVMAGSETTSGNGTPSIVDGTGFRTTVSSVDSSSPAPLDVVIQHSPATTLRPYLATSQPPRQPAWRYLYNAGPRTQFAHPDLFVDWMDTILDELDFKDPRDEFKLQWMNSFAEQRRHEAFKELTTITTSDCSPSVNSDIGVRGTAPIATTKTITTSMDSQENIVAGVKRLKTSAGDDDGAQLDEYQDQVLEHGFAHQRTGIESSQVIQRNRVVNGAAAVDPSSPSSSLIGLGIYYPSRSSDAPRPVSRLPRLSKIRSLNAMSHKQEVELVSVKDEDMETNVSKDKSFPSVVDNEGIAERDERMTQAKKDVIRVASSSLTNVNVNGVADPEEDESFGLRPTFGQKGKSCKMQSRPAAEDMIPTSEITTYTSSLNPSYQDNAAVSYPLATLLEHENNNDDDDGDFGFSPISRHGRDRYQELSRERDCILIRLRELDELSNRVASQDRGGFAGSSNSQLGSDGQDQRGEKAHLRQKLAQWEQKYSEVLLEERERQLQKRHESAARSGRAIEVRPEFRVFATSAGSVRVGAKAGSGAGAKTEAGVVEAQASLSVSDVKDVVNLPSIAATITAVKYVEKKEEGNDKGDDDASGSGSDESSGSEDDTEDDSEDDKDEKGNEGENKSDSDSEDEDEVMSEKEEVEAGGKLMDGTTSSASQPAPVGKAARRSSLFEGVSYFFKRS
ncbi:hypothetical protein EDD11_002420 [Mortierella claussenii]|nr:hypothetical protein EDD11_002420 [Mortierella claussenii]